MGLNVTGAAKGQEVAGVTVVSEVAWNRNSRGD